MEDQPVHEETRTRRPLRERIAEYRVLAIATAILLAAGILAYVLWTWAGPEGSTSLQWAPVPATTLVFISGFTLGLALLLGAILVGCLIGSAHRIVRITVIVILSLAVVAGEICIAVASLVGLLFSAGESSPRPVFGGSYYEKNLGFPDPSYTYYESDGFFLMARDGISTGETRAESDDGKPEPIQSSGSQAPQSGQTSHGNTEGNSDLPIESSQITATGSADGVEYSVAEASQALGGRATYVAMASDDGGATWERRGTIPFEGSLYGYHVVDGSVQLLAFGSGSDSVAPPAYLTRDGGWTWTQLVLPVPADMPPSAQLVEDAARDGSTLTVTLNYPTWVTTRGAGTTFVSHDDGVSWTLASK